MIFFLLRMSDPIKIFSSANLCTTSLELSSKFFLHQTIKENQQYKCCFLLFLEKASAGQDSTKESKLDWRSTGKLGQLPPWKFSVTSLACTAMVLHGVFKMIIVYIQYNKIYTYWAELTWWVIIGTASQDSKAWGQELTLFPCYS